MADDRRRTTLGSATSAAIPALWALLAEHGGSQARLAAFLDVDSGNLSRLLYAKAKAGRVLALRLRGFGIAIDLWEEPLPEGWSLPPVEQTGPQQVMNDASAEEIVRSTGS